MKRLLIGAFIGIGMFFGGAFMARAEALPVDAYFFWGDGCPHCVKEEIVLDALEKEYPTLAIHRFEIFYSNENRALLQEVGSALGEDVSGVPFFVLGDEAISGFSDGVTNQMIESRIKACTESACPDSVAAIVGDGDPADQAATEEQNNEETFLQTATEPTIKFELPSAEFEFTAERSVGVPFFGHIELASLSLPALSVVLGALDGFNPCAMWVLLFLISMLIGMKDRKRMWILGGAFIVTSAFVYFLFMSAWLELILFLGFIVMVRIGIGLVALIGSGYSLREFFTNKDAVCKVGDNQERRKTFDRIKDVVRKKSFVAALAGIVLLAFAVNLVELVCSAGFPAVFTQTLAVNHLPRWEYYGYILLYIFFFMIDDLIVFFISMITLQTAGLTTKYTRASRLIGGILMLIIGLLLLFRPEWLMFG